ncbi:putative signal transducing protein [Gelidibacter maritimus]|uniref:DUF2007 domain-containing protein n=1 Tax=Gelidibacter maritimus TaxID=2761487 RepID=A0A7W2M7H3_9FLAO|nr:DUF2007 domain-containing protein [Gelidibacter maritimus]MBA6154156.1 DUF2007 domain-containing protein [Gelidibacter maritimus]
MSDIKIYSGTSQVRAMEIKNILENENIAYQEVNKMDSSYAGIFGEIQLFVSEADSEKALLLIERTKK